ncbi:hypothetical protein ASPWEDRAFT_33773 [Aspergillus wentii DTO 134E9]|uniref:rRNA methyltransferase 1, mitochondrial n=1 Tax=Aspergillus wentii DTO 134E9 TaxID=1073089 RepID=A0A1L9RZJ7_ASPWE|nr:uncharacterized protein ASPWEDRAFT_33773 [Aspergillus wentii DTO 134E9]KAI9932810.1 hypothetical protein MW887_009062 [Aspergillus wentii]OJJ40390.1 hypothetical protein ASPWEDRAFT_33773 [Aspergillus wentii DTO 134E9]
MPLRAPFSPLWTYLRPSKASSTHLITARYASLNSAISRGIRKSNARDGDNSYSKPRESSYDDRRQRDSRPNRPQNNPKKYGESWRREREFDEDEFIRTGNFRGLPREHQTSRISNFQGKERPSRYQSEPREYQNDRKPSYQSRETRYQSEPRKGHALPPEDVEYRTKRNAGRAETPRHHRFTDTIPERVKDNVRVPDSIPYTTPASEFIYGTSAVEAAMRCSRRQLYKLYIYQGAGEELSAAKVALRKLALSKNIKVKMAFAGWDRLLDKMSAGRPHNGCILEASPLPQLPVRSFHTVSSLDESDFRVELAPQSREEAVVNGMNDRVSINSLHAQERKRYPVTLLLDGIVDTGNMGAIIRSAYYLGIDAIVFAGRNSAPLSPVTIKASAGAAENMTLLQVNNETTFIQQSKANGWRFYAADAPGPGSKYIDPLSNGDSNITNPGDINYNLLTQAPSVIMMGSESSGLSSHIKALADSIVSIPGARLSPTLGVASDPARVDSLNVSVAAALLMEMFLRVPLAVSEMPQSERVW